MVLELVYFMLYFAFIVTLSYSYFITTIHGEDQCDSISISLIFWIVKMVFALMNLCMLIKSNRTVFYFLNALREQINRPLLLTVAILINLLIISMLVFEYLLNRYTFCLIFRAINMDLFKEYTMQFMIFYRSKIYME